METVSAERWGSLAGDFCVKAEGRQIPGRKKASPLRHMAGTKARHTRPGYCQVLSRKRVGKCMCMLVARTSIHAGMSPWLSVCFGGGVTGGAYLGPGREEKEEDSWCVCCIPCFPSSPLTLGFPASSYPLCVFKAGQPHP